MKYSDFAIGTEFTTNDGQKHWRCTDIGTRTVIAICLDPHLIHVVRKNQVKDEITNDPSWFNGPPYAVVERVFDEYDLAECRVNA